MAAVGSSSLLCLQGLSGPFWVHPFCPSMDSCWVHLLTDRFCCPVYVGQFGFKVNLLSYSSK